MKKVVCIPSIEKEQNKNPLQSATILEFEKIVNILRNNEYKITFHPLINGVIAWKPHAKESLVNLVVLNFFNGRTADFIEHKKWNQEILNILFEKPEILLSDVKFKTLTFPLAGKVKIPYINNFPARVNISMLIFNTTKLRVENDLVRVRNSSEFIEILRRMEISQRRMNHVDFSDFQKTLVRFFLILSIIWSAAFTLSFLNLLQPITLIIATTSLVVPSFIFTAVRTKKIFNKIKVMIFHQNKDILLVVQRYSLSDVASCFNRVVEAFLNKDWLKFDSLAKHLLNMLSGQTKIDTEIYSKMNMLKEILLTDISLRNESSHFFILNELSRILKDLNLLEFDVEKIFKEKARQKNVKTEVFQEDSGCRETLEKAEKLTSSAKFIQKNSSAFFKVNKNEATQSNSDKGSMGVVFHPIVSSVDDFLKFFKENRRDGYR